MAKLKTTFNKYINRYYPSWRTDEIALFRTLMDVYARNSNVVTATEIHGGHNGVGFYSSLFQDNVTKELGDLLLISHDKAKHTVRICIMQNKYRRKKLPKNYFSCTVDVIQWELLKERYTITSKGQISFPRNILNFRRDYRSISSYGIFYRDICNNYDFFYTIPEFLYPSRQLRVPVKSNSHCQTFRIGFDCNKPICPNSCSLHIPQCTDEATIACNFNSFDSFLQAGRIGTPLEKSDNGINAWILGVLQYLLSALTSNNAGTANHHVTGNEAVIKNAIETLRNTLAADERYRDDLYSGPFKPTDIHNVLLIETSN